MSQGLDMLSLPSHTSHQSLDVACFKPFKMAFWAYRDKWTLNHKRKLPLKEDLVQWVAQALKRALSNNITKKFKQWAFSHSMDLKMGPSQAYARHGQVDTIHSLGEQ